MEIWLLRIYDEPNEFTAYSTFEKAVDAAKKYIKEELNGYLVVDFKDVCDGYNEEKKYFYIDEVMDCYPITYYN